MINNRTQFQRPAIACNGLQPYVTFGCFPKNKKATKLRKGAVSPSFLINEI